jgi:hypothetical protein
MPRLTSGKIDRTEARGPYVITLEPGASDTLETPAEGNCLPRWPRCSVSRLWRADFFSPTCRALKVARRGYVQPAG